MRIAIATGPMLPVPPTAGGAMVRAMLDLASAMAARGHEVSILACRRPGQSEREPWRNLSIYRRGGFRQSRFLFRDLCLDAIDALQWRRHIPDCDVLITNDVFLPMVLQGKNRRFAIMATVARWPKRHYRWYGGVDRFAAISTPVAAALSEVNPNLRDRIDVLPIGYDRTIFAASPDSTRNQISFVGRIHPEKGIHLIIEACRQMGTDAQPVRIVGPWQVELGGGGDEYLDTLRSAASGLDIQFTGPEFDQTRLAAELNRTKVFVYPSIAEKGEALGLAPIEAMACGAVAVTSALPCFRDFIEHEATGFVFDHLRVDAAKDLARCLRLAWAAADDPGFVVASRKAAARFHADSLADHWLASCQLAIDGRRNS